MWMMGYNDSGDFNMPDSFNGRKLRPLIPRPVASTNNPSSGTSPCLGRIHGTDFFGINHHLGSHFGDQNKREFNTPPVAVSSRWNPTPEQLRTLEELYRRGTRTPSADQIQHITAQLRRYGKIEGKNVFYWFQNHKARERQKRRRQMESAIDHHHQHHEHNNIHDIENFERNNKDHPAASKTGYEVEQTKNWAAPTNCSTLAEESVSFQRSPKAVSMAECRQGSSGWIQFDEAGELQHRSNRSFNERNATWQMMQLSCPSPSTHLINTNNTTTVITKTTRDGHQSTTPASIRAAMDQNQLIKTHDLNFFFSSYRENFHGFNHLNPSNIVGNHGENECGGESDQTLQLFPLQSGDDGSTGNDSDKVTADPSVSAAIDANLTPCQFFEFLPLKN